MNRIMIIGSPGTGKSTLAKELEQRMGLPLYHLDKFYWHDNWQPVPQEEFGQMISKIVRHPNGLLTEIIQAR